MGLVRISMNVKYLLILFLLPVYDVTAQSEHAIHFGDITIIFPDEPTITQQGDYREQYVTETKQGTFSLIKQTRDTITMRVNDEFITRKYDDPVIVDNFDVDAILDATAQHYLTDPNLGDSAQVERVTIAGMKGLYTKIELGSEEPALIILFLTLMSAESPNTYSLCYQYWDDGREPMYDKEEFLAVISE